jgi:hypothetical protein
MTITTRNTTSVGYVTNKVATLTQNELDANFVDLTTSRDKTQHCRLILGNTDPTVPTYPTAYTTVSLIPYGGNSMFFGAGTALLPYKNLVFSTITVTVSTATRIEGGTGITSGSTAYWYVDASSGAIVLKHSLTITPSMNSSTGFLQGSGAAADMIFVGCTRATSTDTSTRTAAIEPCYSWFNRRSRSPGYLLNSSGFLNGMGTTLTGTTIYCFNSSSQPILGSMSWLLLSVSAITRVSTTMDCLDLDRVGSQTVIRGSTTHMTASSSGAACVTGPVQVNVDNSSTQYPNYGSIDFSCSLSAASTSGTWESSCNTVIWY